MGAGGHAQVVGDAIEAAARVQPGSVEVAGYLDDDPGRLGQELVGGRVQGAFAGYAAVPHDTLIVAVGTNLDRRRIFLDLVAKGCAFGTVIHPASVMAPDVVLGDGVVIMAGVVINTGTHIGRNVILNTACSIDHHSTVGDHAHVAPGARLGGGVTVGAGALIGMGAVVLPGLRIGDAATVGAGAVVVHDVLDHTTVVGNPARPAVVASP